MKKICVVYEETRNGRNALCMAVDVARVFDAELHVHVAISDADDGEAEELARVQNAVAEVAGHKVFALVTYVPPMAPTLGEDELLVLPRKPKPADDGDEVPPRPSEMFATTCGAQLGLADFLMPADEVSLRRNQGPILVPFSDGDSGLVATTAALKLALQRRERGAVAGDDPEIIFYHTTWPDPKSGSAEAIDQMCEEATRVMLAVEDAAKQAGVTFRTIVETHDDVVQGVIEMAQATRSALIVMARGARIRQGSYVGRMLQQSPIPVFVSRSQTPFCRVPAEDRMLMEFRTQRRDALLAQQRTAEHVPLWRKLLDAPILRKPMFVAGVVAFAYILKASAKIGVGTWISSPMITGDGFHNIADVLEVLAIGVVLFITARQATERYPYGRKNMEWFTQLGIGIGLFAAAGKFIVDCIVGLLSYAPTFEHTVRGFISWLPEHEPVTMNSHTFPWVVAVTGISFLMSLVLSRYQIMVGKRTGHASLIANGEEAASDGWIECVTVVGVIAEFLTGWGFLEYVLGLVVALMIMRTAKELFTNGWRVLLQHSIGEEHESAIRSACDAVRGVSAVTELKTFQIGHTAVVMVTCESLAGSHAMSYIKKAVEAAIRWYVVHDDSDFKGVDIHVKMQRPDPGRHRIGYGVWLNANGVPVLAKTLEALTHIAVCDVEHDDIVRSKLVPVKPGKLAEVLIDKRVQKLYVLNAPPAKAAQVFHAVGSRLRPAEFGVVPQTELVEATTRQLPVLGLAV